MSKVRRRVLGMDSRSLTELIAPHRLRWLGHLLRVLPHRLPFRAVFARVGHGWKKRRGGQIVTWHRGMWKLTSDLASIGAVRQTLRDMAQNGSFCYPNYLSFSILTVAQHRRRRAKALLDFTRHEPDELGFRKNDIITIINSEDEHCWVGELNGLRGWFPAKFVELLDERGKNYSPAGDDGVDQRIVQLVRGHFCNALGAVFTHGLKRPRLLGESGCHPWHFIEEAAAKEVERDFNSVYSRLVLCKTFRLDEEGKVLSPEEVLYRVSMFLITVIYRLHSRNEQLLHMWLETLCSSVKVIEKWYHPWSYLRSPGWVQIKCELRLMDYYYYTLFCDDQQIGESPLVTEACCSVVESGGLSPNRLGIVLDRMTTKMLTTKVEWR
ncbi:unnamed protein product [Echinostoma caproni]|uniref:SH3 domain-containing protein n=1 Tax=Echinostoma caproni TaxID=27848 RepID=A0A183AW06_9TREM|nr:unnamed protein product [Echinostoma caproni]